LDKMDLGNISSDRITIKDLVFFGRHGVLSDEALYGQNFIIDANLFLDLKKAGMWDDLSMTVSYSEIYELIRSVVEEERFQLIEALAEHICIKVLKFSDKIQRIELTVKKPEAPVEGTFEYFGVTLIRENVKAAGEGLSNNKVFLSLGSNIGDRENNLNQALLMLGDTVKIVNRSSFYETAPVDYIFQDRFLNMVIEIQTSLQPMELLDLLQMIENNMGREKTIRFGPRNIDIDILLYKNIIYETEELTIPHPRMKERGFVLIPLQEIEPRLRIDDQSINDLIMALDHRKDVKWSTKRIDRIIKDDDFIKYMGYNEKHEIDRIFCHHDMAHLMDVCREAWIIKLENNFGLSKDVIYAAGLLHDIGRWMEYEGGMDHAAASAELASEILDHCKFSTDEKHRIIHAIINHRYNENDDELSRVLYTADKQSRFCQICKARNQCKRYL